MHIDGCISLGAKGGLGAEGGGVGWIPELQCQIWLSWLYRHILPNFLRKEDWFGGRGEGGVSTQTITHPNLQYYKKVDIPSPSNKSMIPSFPAASCCIIATRVFRDKSGSNRVIGLASSGNCTSLPYWEGTCWCWPWWPDELNDEHQVLKVNSNK